MPDSRGVPTLADLIGQTTDWAKSIQTQKDKDNEFKKQYQQSHIVDPKTGKSMAGVFNPMTGEYQPSQFQLGYAPKIDPETGYVLPNSVTEQSGLNATGLQTQPPMGATQNPPAVPRRTPFSPVQRKGVDDAITRLKSDPNYKESEAALLKMDELIQKTTLAQSNPVAAKQLGAEVASLYEGGRLTDEDVLRYTKDPSVAGVVRDIAYKAASGVISPETAKYLRIALEAKRSSAQGRMGQLSDIETQRVQGVYGVSPGATKNVLSPPQMQKMTRPIHSPDAEAARNAISQPPPPTSVDKLRSFLFGDKQSTPTPAPMSFEQFKAMKRSQGN